MWEVRQARWTINGQKYHQTLDMIIEQALRLLKPAQAGPAIVGHGDAHNGNVFFREDSGSMLYFDPAFAGRHHPVLDMTKPLFHNVFAMWMYFPLEVEQDLQISLRREGDSWLVDHDFRLHPVREMFWTSKVERILLPILIELKQRDWLRSDWRDFLKAALFCCPYLTMNLSDSAKFPPAISLLGLTMAVEMGAESAGRRSYLDNALDNVAAQL
jgi:hypothetical protein